MIEGLEERLLVSFPNQKRSRAQRLFCFANVDERKKLVRWIRCGTTKRVDLGVSGCAVLGGILYVVIQSKKKPKVISIDPKNWRIREIYFLKKVQDPHCLVVHQGKLFLASTGNNSIYSLLIDGDSIVGEEEVWHFPNTSFDQDDVHLNGLVFIDDQMVISAFGRRNTEGDWSKNGILFNVITGSAIRDHLDHPHSAQFLNGLLVFAESNIGMIHIGKMKGRLNFDFLNIKVGGYPRGILIRKDHLIVGQSKIRQISRSTGATINTESKDLGFCGLVKIDLNDYTCGKIIDLSSSGPEIYSVLDVKCCLPSKAHAPSSIAFFETMKAFIQRLT